MKLKTREIDAIIAKLQEEQSASRKQHEDAERKKLDGDPKFDRIASLVKDELNDFDFILDIPRNVETFTIEKLAEWLRQEWHEIHYTPSDKLKSKQQLMNEIVMVADKCKTLQDICDAIDPFVK